MVDYLALIGDSSDNIPGIDKVGPKTGAKLLQRYGGLDELIAHVAEVPGKVGENLRAGLATLELSRRLATIRTDLELPLSPEELTPGAPDVARLRELYTRSEEHTSELQSHSDLVCRLLLEKKKKNKKTKTNTEEEHDTHTTQQGTTHSIDNTTTAL